MRARGFDDLGKCSCKASLVPAGSPSVSADNRSHLIQLAALRVRPGKPCVPQWSCDVDACLRTKLVCILQGATPGSSRPRPGLHLVAGNTPKLTKKHSARDKKKRLEANKKTKEYERACPKPAKQEGEDELAREDATRPPRSRLARIRRRCHA